ncbi:MAG: cell division protein FtsZ [Candidatus Puniceispirillaceae bacterium]
MSINLTVPQTMQELRPRITVIGVGGAGCNAVNNMINANLDGVDFLVANTDGQALAHSLAPRKIQLGTNLTAGLGAGSKPDIGRQAAEESMNEVIAELHDCNMVFITAGMGGGTGTGAAPVIARAARENGILTVGVVTKPFEFEGPRRMKQANTGIEQLAAHVDTLIVVPNQNLFHVTNERTTFADAFHMADEVLYQGVSGVTDLMLKPGIINLDFADIRSVMTEMGKAMMGTGEASGENRAIIAAETAINNPLLEDTTLLGAKALIVNVTGGPELGFYEVDEAVQRIRREVDEDANLIFGSAIDDSLDGTIRVSVVATGIDANSIAAPIPAPMRPNTAGIATGLSSDEAAAKEDSNVKLPEDTAFDAPIPTKVMDGSMPEMADRLDSDVPVMMGDVPEDNQEMPAMTQEPVMDQEVTSSSDQQDAQAEASSDNDTAQLDLEEAVARIDDLAQEAESMAPAPQDSFIPSEPLSVDAADVVSQTDPIPETRPSLIRQISGLWRPRGKAEEAEAPVAGEPAAPEAPAILNLSRGAALQETLPIGQQSSSDKDEADDELDIPAFLRRQAN